MSIDMAEAQASTSTIIKDGYEIPPIDCTAETMSSSSLTIVSTNDELHSDDGDFEVVHGKKRRKTSQSSASHSKENTNLQPALKAELLKLTKLCALPVRAFLPSDRTNCYGVLRDIDPDCTEHDIKTRLQSTACITEVKRLGKTSPVVRCYRCHKFGHIAAPAQKKPSYVLGVDNATTTSVEPTPAASIVKEITPPTHLSAQRHPLTIVSAYVAPNAAWDTHVLADIRMRAKGDLIVAVDFNALSKSWGDKQNSSRGRELQATVEALNLRNITSGSQTFIRPGGTESVIDLTFTTWSLRLSATPQADSWGSDHLPIVIGKPPKSPLRACQIVDWDHYRTLLIEALEGGFPFNSETLSRVLKEATREVRVPLTRPNPDLEWLKLRARKRRAQRKSWVTRKPEDILEYRRLDARFRKHGKKLARRQWRLKCSTLDRPTGGSRAWRMSRTLAGHPIPRNPVLGMAVAMNLRPTEMVELLADTFTEVPLVPTVGPPPENWDRYRHPTAPLMQQPDADFTLHELQYVLDALPRHRAAPGPDGVTNQALRNVNESALPAMLALINLCLEDG
ncbi:hypothetical protein HPB47_001832 [Ixodes persulcatus]|uniref:Uncharacterized protein n=1 Tax=Ixodes persulcatus TaxID=34615 RepID=A0AC60PMY6_IXOPE|nr:hypothetical protein HPB47_001832 [Ixodes persulcatus]